MPEFIADTDGTVNGFAWNDLSPFIRGYIECILFTETSCIPMVEWHNEVSQERVREGEADGNIPNDSGFGDIHPDTLNRIMKDCGDFQARTSHLLAEAYSRPMGKLASEGYYCETNAGRDFWFTRNGHGAGFWCREVLKEDSLGDRLSAFAKEWRETNAWFSEVEEATSPTGYGFVYLD